MVKYECRQLFSEAFQPLITTVENVEVLKSVYHIILGATYFPWALTLVLYVIAASRWNILQVSQWTLGEKERTWEVTTLELQAKTRKQQRVRHLSECLSSRLTPRTDNKQVAPPVQRGSQ
jgi:hypothetical protein